jgi:hypothetical protein
MCPSPVTFWVIFSLLCNEQVARKSRGKGEDAPDARFAFSKCSPISDNGRRKTKQEKLAEKY